MRGLMPLSTVPLRAYVSEKVVPWIRRVEVAERGQGPDQGMRLPALRRHVRSRIFELAAQVEVLLTPLHDHPSSETAAALTALTRYHAALFAIVDSTLPERRPFNPELLRRLTESLETMTAALPQEVPSLEELTAGRPPRVPLFLNGFPAAEATE
jgi:hypothetical protein